ncbi:GNAT family N-acetyltransferase [Geomonas oryzisoli]|uniref:GNAT family N-acetyltransferase n=1 Tax=Geomonas oryzisoli TaxID=2847992 RepID=A0ABX8J617_9BACT|nr:GNAT family N-acetyltransferase [Geomonas oryzisoli]QWV92762.1 GNAT family N-acetyltransferase [Geomonas oryzisoli]
MNFEFVGDSAGFCSIAKDWESLEARAGGHLFQNHRFLKSWLQATGDGEKSRPAVVLGWEGERLMAVFPGCLMRSGFPFLTWMGGLNIVDYGDILFDQNASISADAFLDMAFALLKKKVGFHLYYLHNVRRDARAFNYLERNFTHYRDEVAPFVPLVGDFESYLESLRQFRKNMRSDTLRQMKRMASLGVFEFRIVKPQQSDDAASPGAADAVEVFVTQKRRQFEETGVAGALMRPGYDEFYQTEASENPHAHISCLTLDGKIIAVHFGYLYGDRFYYLMPAYDPGYAKYSPGRVLTYFLLQHCYSRGVQVFDFALGAEPYKYEWTADQMEETSFIGGGFWGKYLVLALKGKKAIARRLAAIGKERTPGGRSQEARDVTH